MAFSYTSIIENDHCLASNFWVGSLEKGKKKEFMGEINLIGLEIQINNFILIFTQLQYAKNICV
jgi:hypothetical protein